MQNNNTSQYSPERLEELKNKRLKLINSNIGLVHKNEKELKEITRLSNTIDKIAAKLAENA